MYRGSVDAVSRTEATGWALCTEAPDAVVDVSIFLNGRKLHQVECARLRPDLRRLGGFGEGKHGFRFQFPQPLDTDRDYRLSFRVAKTGKLLGNGDVAVHAGGPISMRSPHGPQLAGEPDCLPLPRNLRGLFEMLTLCRDTTSVYDLLSRLDLDGAPSGETRALIDTSFGRPLNRTATPKYSFRDHLNDVLLSDRFQRELIRNLLNAFPEKRRLFFIHVPKCAGTDLSAHLMRMYPFVHQKITETDWASKDEFFAAISRLVQNIKFYEDIFVTGHNSLRYYSARNLIRRYDRVFTVLRHPVEIAKSRVNYIMTRLTTDAKTGQYHPDSKGWLKCLDREALPPEIPKKEIQSLCASILKSPKIIPPNSMCSWLGGENAEDAARQLIEHDVEISFTEHYTAWLNQNWGVASRTRLNQSNKFASPQTMRRARPHIEKRYGEDIKLYDMVHQAMCRSGGVSIRGREIRV